jgi:hypothetical protein
LFTSTSHLYLATTTQSRHSRFTALVNESICLSRPHDGEH